MFLDDYVYGTSARSTMGLNRVMIWYDYHRARPLSIRTPCQPSIAVAYQISVAKAHNLERLDERGRKCFILNLKAPGQKKKKDPAQILKGINQRQRRRIEDTHTHFIVSETNRFYNRRLTQLDLCTTRSPTLLKLGGDVKLKFVTNVSGPENNRKGLVYNDPTTSVGNMEDLFEKSEPEATVVSHLSGFEDLDGNSALDYFLHWTCCSSPGPQSVHKRFKKLVLTIVKATCTFEGSEYADPVPLVSEA
ncbi:hypothetical protein EDD22DRAFT_1053916 [Suillus occidentalis]|nr:hypothetical protein EDD22DRAFT_1053916 [Suillus occidentalis]